MNIPIPAKLTAFRPWRMVVTINALIDCVKAGVILRGPGVIVNRMAEGTSVMPVMRPQPATAASQPVSFACTYAGLAVEMVKGKVYLKGVDKTITDWPIDSSGPPVTVADTTTIVPPTGTGTEYAWGYIEIDFAASTAKYKVVYSDPGNGTDTIEKWRIWFATLTDGAITDFLSCQHGDIHLAGNA